MARLRRHLGIVSRLVFVVDGARIARDLGLAAADAWSGEAPPADGGAADGGAARAPPTSPPSPPAAPGWASGPARSRWRSWWPRPTSWPAAEPWAGLGPRASSLEGGERQDLDPPAAPGFLPRQSVVARPVSFSGAPGSSRSRVWASGPSRPISTPAAGSCGARHPAGCWRRSNFCSKTFCHRRCGRGPGKIS